MKKYSMGIDFGTLSVRALIVDAVTGEQVSEATSEYAHGVMSSTLPDGTPLRAQSALQHPADYIVSMQTVISRSLESAGLAACDIAGIGVDFTACTMLAVDEDATPLCFLDEFAKDPNAYAKLWKSHSAEDQARRITELAEREGAEWLKIYGGKVSSEWLFPKILETLECSPELFERTHAFVEAGNWIVRLLTGNDVYAPSFAGYKALWNAESGFPSNSFFARLDPRLDGIVGTRVRATVDSIDAVAGYVSRQGANLFGLCEGTPVAMPIIDAHAGLPAIGITGEGDMMMMLGTSGCYLLHTKDKKDIAGIGGYTEGAVFADIYTYEAGQCCFGDCFDWYVANFVPEKYSAEAREQGKSIHKYLREKAQALSVGESGLLVLDWFNGNRSVLCDSDLSGMILGLKLTTRPEEIYRALMEGVAFGARLIIENYTDNGIRVSRACATGGIALKDELLMQILSDVTGLTIEVANCPQACALGSAMYGAVAGGLCADMSEAVARMSKPTVKTYFPNADNKRAYDALFAEYKTLHDYFGRGENDVMKRLLKK